MANGITLKILVTLSGKAAEVVKNTSKARGTPIPILCRSIIGEWVETKGDDK